MATSCVLVLNDKCKKVIRKWNNHSKFTQQAKFTYSLLFDWHSCFVCIVDENRNSLDSSLSLDETWITVFGFILAINEVNLLLMKQDFTYKNYGKGVLFYLKF